MKDRILAGLLLLGLLLLILMYGSPAVSRRLTEEEYRLIRMVYYEGASTEEAALTLGVTAAACRKRIQRIRDKLRERYTE